MEYQRKWVLEFVIDLDKITNKKRSFLRLAFSKPIGEGAVQENEGAVQENEGAVQENEEV
jgi:hypothetical protein